MKKDKYLNIRIDDATLLKLKEKATQANESVSSFVLKAALDAKIKTGKAPLFDFESAKGLITQLTKIGTNINQISKALNKDVNLIVDYRNDLKTAIDAVLGIIETIAEKAEPRKKKTETDGKLFEPEEKPEEKKKEEKEKTSSVKKTIVGGAVDEIKQDKPKKKCPKCGSDMIIKTGENGVFWGCTRKDPFCDRILPVEDDEMPF